MSMHAKPQTGTKTDAWCIVMSMCIQKRTFQFMKRLCCSFVASSASLHGCQPHLLHDKTQDEQSSLLPHAWCPLCSFHGQSGSPVWLYDTTSGERFVRGVLTHRTLTGSGQDVPGPGSFTIMSQQVFEDITAWMTAA